MTVCSSRNKEVHGHRFDLKHNSKRQPFKLDHVRDAVGLEHPSILGKVNSGVLLNATREKRPARPPLPPEARG